MENDIMAFLRIFFMGTFILTILAGIVVLKNYERLFGVDPRYPSENSSQRAYSKVQVISVWVHTILLTGAFAFFL